MNPTRSWNKEAVLDELAGRPQRQRSNIERLLKAFTYQEADRVPYLDYWVSSRQIKEYVLGRPISLELPAAEGTNVALARETEGLWASPEDDVEFALRIGADAVAAHFSWRPCNVWRDAADGSKHYVDGEVKTWDDLQRMGEFPDPSPELRKLERCLEAAEGTGLGVYASVSSFFDGSYLAMGVQDFMYLLHDNRPLVERVLDTMAEYHRALMERLAQYSELSFVFINDDIGYNGGLFINPGTFRELFVARMASVIAPIRARGKILTFHTDGDLSDIIPILHELGYSSVHPVEPESNDIYALKQQWQGTMSLVGNISTVMLAYGTREQIVADVREHMDRLKPGGGYIVGSQNSVFSGIPPENFLAMVETVWEHGKYR